MRDEIKEQFVVMTRCADKANAASGLMSAVDGDYIVEDVLPEALLNSTEHENIKVVATQQLQAGGQLLINVGDAFFMGHVLRPIHNIDGHAVDDDA